MEEKEVTTIESLSNDEVEESTLNSESDESVEQETSAETSTDIETSTTFTSYETTTTAVTIAVDAESLNSFTRSANYLMCFFVIYFVCKALYRLINIFF